jgi:GAF domain-containing protein
MGMKFFQNKSLTSQVSFLLVFLIILLIFQFVVIRRKVTSLEQLHFQRDFARNTQVSGQQLFMNVVLLLQGNQSLSSQIVSGIDQQEHDMKTLSDGGRIDGTTVFIGKLQELPRISFDELREHWGVFRQTVQQTSLSEGLAHPQKNLNLIHARWLSISAWYSRLIDDMDKLIGRERSSLNFWIGLIALFDIGLCLTAQIIFKRGIINPLKILRTNTSNHTHTLGLPPNEIGAVASQVNDVIEQLKDASDFVQGIGQGNFTVSYEELDKDYKPGTNKLADSLIDMQGKLKHLNEEDQRRQWVNEGLTKFVDILRSGGDNIKSLGDSIISTLINYTGSNQGSLYLLNDSEPGNAYLELISLFAFDIKKFENKKIKIGEGILGQTFLEKEVTYLKNIPQEYIRITSGLGEANPSSLLVVPLKIDRDVFGVIELASFKDFREHEINFVERLGETIASTFATVKAAQRNRELLDEAKSATEMMRSQEEEMRQNMEELQATQEEMARKERDYIAKIEDLEKQTRDSKSPAEIDKLNSELTSLRRQQEDCTRALEAERQKIKPADEEWRIAEQVEKTLRINLEAIRIMQEEFDRNNKT